LGFGVWGLGFGVAPSFQPTTREWGGEGQKAMEEGSMTRGVTCKIVTIIHRMKRRCYFGAVYVAACGEGGDGGGKTWAGGWGGAAPEESKIETEPSSSPTAMRGGEWWDQEEHSTWGGGGGGG
jgi:hypothetical protein